MHTHAPELLYLLSAQDDLVEIHRQFNNIRSPLIRTVRKNPHGPMPYSVLWNEQNLLQVVHFHVPGLETQVFRRTVAQDRLTVVLYGFLVIGRL